MGHGIEDYGSRQPSKCPQSILDNIITLTGVQYRDISRPTGTRGDIEVHRDIAEPTEQAFSKIYFDILQGKFALHGLRLASRYQHNNYAIREGNVSCGFLFDPRSEDPDAPSLRAQGLAISLNPFTNPIITKSGKILGGSEAADRIEITRKGDYRSLEYTRSLSPQLIEPDNEVVAIMATHGFAYDAHPAHDHFNTLGKVDFSLFVFDPDGAQRQRNYTPQS